MENVKKSITSKIGISLLAILMLVPAISVANNNNVADAKAGKKVSCGKNGQGQICYKLSYYITPAQTKKLAQTKKELDTPAAIANFVGLAGFGPGVVALGFGSAVNANQVFVDAAKQGKGVQVSYINHQSVSTAHSYNTNGHYKIK